MTSAEYRQEQKELVRQILARRGPTHVLDVEEEMRSSSNSRHPARRSLIEEGIILDYQWFVPLPGGFFADVEAVASSLVVTHRLTEQERALGHLHVCPDLMPLMLAGHSLKVAPGSAVSMEFTPERPFGELVGPAGWLERFEPGKLISIRAGRSQTVSARGERPALGLDVSRPSRTSDPTVAAQIILAVFHAFGTPFQRAPACEVGPLVLAAAALVPSAFSKPQLPLSELLGTVPLILTETGAVLPR